MARFAALALTLALTLGPGLRGPAAGGDELPAGSPGTASPGRAPPGTALPGAALKATWELETVSGVETLPAAELDSLAIVPAGPGPGGGGGKCRLGAREWPLDELLFLRPPAAHAPARAAALLLRDGSEVRGRVLTTAPAVAAADALTLEAPSVSDKPFVVALDLVQALVPCGPAVPGGEAAILDAIETARALKSKKDVALLAGESRLEGVLDGLDEGGIRFSTESTGQGVKIPYDRLRAVVLAMLDEEPSPAGPADSRLRASLHDGTILGAQLASLDKGLLRLQTRALGQIEIPLTAARELAFLGGRVSYLSDRQPLRVREVPGAAFRSAAEMRLGHRRDRNVLGGPLRLGAREHKKGLGVHSYSLLEYEVTGGFQRFQATIGLDRCAQPPPGATGSEARVVFRVLLDGKAALERPMSWQDKPAAIDVQLGPARVIGLEVDYGDAADLRSFLNAALDRADWADARFVK